MSYQVLARKWRPQNFQQVVGQQHVLTALVNALDQGRLHHAYLLSGTRGVGKTSIARILAKSLNCEKGITSLPCGECATCKEIDQGSYVDLLEIDAASRTKVEDTRELLDNVQYKPARGRFKVYLIDEVHMLSKHSFNALLKTLEEPPEYVKFLLATTDPQKLPITVLSRCLQFHLKSLTGEEITQQLVHVLSNEHCQYELSALHAIAKAADGSMRDALSLTDQALSHGSGNILHQAVLDMLGTLDQSHIGQLLRLVASGNANGCMIKIAEVSLLGADYDQLHVELASLLHRIAMAQLLPSSQLASNAEMTDENSEHIAFLSDLLSPEEVQLYYQITLNGRKELPLAPDPRSALEMTILRLLAFRPQKKIQQPVSIPALTEPAQSAVQSETVTTEVAVVNTAQVVTPQTEISQAVETQNAAAPQIDAELPDTAQLNAEQAEIMQAAAEMGYNSEAVPQQAEQMQSAPQQVETQNSAPIQSVPQQVEAQSPAPMQSVPQQVEAQNSAPIQSAPQQVEPQSSAPMPSAPQQAEPQNTAVAQSVAPENAEVHDGREEGRRTRNYLRSRIASTGKKTLAAKNNPGSSSLSVPAEPPVKRPAAPAAASVVATVTAATHTTEPQAVVQPAPSRAMPKGGVGNDAPPRFDAVPLEAYQQNDADHSVPDYSVPEHHASAVSAPVRQLDRYKDVAVDMSELAPSFQPQKSETSRVVTLENRALRDESDPWCRYINKMNLGGRVRQMALHSVMQQDGDQIHLLMNPDQRYFVNERSQATLQESLTTALGQDVTLNITFGEDPEKSTPAQIEEKIYQQRLAMATKNLYDDKHIQFFINRLGAEIDDSSIVPLNI